MTELICNFYFKLSSVIKKLFFRIEEEKDQSITQSVKEVFVEQPLASTVSAIFFSKMIYVC